MTPQKPCRPPPTYLMYGPSPTFSLMFLRKKQKNINPPCCVETKGHTYLGKPAGKSSKSTKSEVFLKEVLINLRTLASNNY